MGWEEGLIAYATVFNAKVWKELFGFEGFFTIIILSGLKK